MTDVLLVRVGDRQVGLAVESLVEVIELTAPFPVPSATPALRGVIPVRERLVPVLHLGAALDGTSCPDRLGEMAVIATIDERMIGLEVDDASEVTTAVITPLPEDLLVPGAVGVVQREGVFVPVIDVALLGAQLIDIGTTT
ncbi:MAG: chemotaxis protein CheW [Gemmatimonadales bacterium]